jgi:UDP-N-acetylmuramoyl-L-alanyl-D-glutamate--2,6-diaminopimelate ligase
MTTSDNALQIYEDDLLDMQGEVGRHVIEDRFSAIRAAISIGQPNDVVVIAGKGSEDFHENLAVSGDVFKGWFDDRVEARNALSMLPRLEAIPYLIRKIIPWTSTLH